MRGLGFRADEGLDVDLYDAGYPVGIPFLNTSTHPPTILIPFYRTGVQRMKMVSVYLPESYLSAIDELVRENYYISRGEILRTAVRELIRKESEKTIHSSNNEPIPIYG